MLTSPSPSIIVHDFVTRKKIRNDNNNGNVAQGRRERLGADDTKFMDAKKINVARPDRVSFPSVLACACVRARVYRSKNIGRSTRRGKENNHFWVRNNKSKLGKPLSIRFPPLPRRRGGYAGSRCSRVYEFS